MGTLFDLFRTSGEHRFPFELLDHFDLGSVKELTDITSGQPYHEIIFSEREGQPTIHVQRSFHDYPMQGIPTLITFQRNLVFQPNVGLRYCKTYAGLAATLYLHEEIKGFLSSNYEMVGQLELDKHKLLSRKTA